MSTARVLSMAGGHRWFMIRTGQLSLICPPLVHSLLSLAAPWGRNIIAQIGQLVNRQIAQILFFVQNAQNDTHGAVVKKNKKICANCLLTNEAFCSIMDLVRLRCYHFVTFVICCNGDVHFSTLKC